MVENSQGSCKRDIGSVLLSFAIIRHLIVIIFFLSLVSSCASVPVQTYMGKNKLSKFNKVAVNVSTTELDVKYSRETGMSIGTSASLTLFPLFGFAVMVAEGVGKSSADRELVQDVKSNTDAIHFDNILRDYFLDNLKKANVFKMVSCADFTDSKAHKKLLDDGYDSLVELEIKELALRKDYADKMKVYVDVRGRMIDLKKGEIVWDRQEVVINNDAHTIESYKSGGGKILKESVDLAFKKIAARLANDFIYSR